MDKYLHLRKLSGNFYQWFDWNILYVEGGIHVIATQHEGMWALSMSELDTKLEELWQTKYKSEMEV